MQLTRSPDACLELLHAPCRCMPHAAACLVLLDAQVFKGSKGPAPLASASGELDFLPGFQSQRIVIFLGMVFG